MFGVMSSAEPYCQLNNDSSEELLQCDLYIKAGGAKIVSFDLSICESLAAIYNTH
jgi:hypothetical protein